MGRLIGVEMDGGFCSSLAGRLIGDDETDGIFFSSLVDLIGEETDGTFFSSFAGLTDDETD